MRARTRPSTCSGCCTTACSTSRLRTPRDPDRDRFLLSKGHGPMAYYAVLAAKGFIPVDELSRLARTTRLSATTRTGVLVPGVEISSGSLGHGLPLAVGVALGLRAQGAHASARRLPRRRRRARRGLEPRGDRACRPTRRSIAHRRSSSTTRRRPTAGPAASPRGSRPRAGRAGRRRTRPRRARARARAARRPAPDRRRRRDRREA